MDVGGIVYYNLFEMNMYITVEQDIQMDILLEKGYKFNLELTKSYDGIVMEKDEDLWIFTLDGEIINEPKFELV